MLLLSRKVGTSWESSLGVCSRGTIVDITCISINQKIIRVSRDDKWRTLSLLNLLGPRWSRDNNRMTGWGARVVM